MLYDTKIFENDLVAMRKTCKPTYVGMCILDLSRVLMFEFHYGCIKHKYGNSSRLLFTDTDSLMNKIKTEVVSVRIKKCLTLATILPSQNIIMIQTN